MRLLWCIVVCIRVSSRWRGDDGDGVGRSERRKAINRTSVAESDPAMGCHRTTVGRTNRTTVFIPSTIISSSEAALVCYSLTLLSLSSKWRRRLLPSPCPRCTFSPLPRQLLMLHCFPHRFSIWLQPNRRRRRRRLLLSYKVHGNFFFFYSRTHEWIIWSQKIFWLNFLGAR